MPNGSPCFSVFTLYELSALFLRIAFVSVNKLVALIKDEAEFKISEEFH